MSRAASLFLATALAVGLLATLSLPSAGALEASAVQVRVSVKRVLSAGGAPPTGRWGLLEEIQGAFERSNATLSASRAGWTLDLIEIRDTRAASAYYSMAPGHRGDLEASARRDPAGYFWRANAVNIYVVDELTEAGGVCSFHAGGVSTEIIIINSQGIFGGSQGWLHEIGHYFNLIHTHEGDMVADTLQDPPVPDPFDCRLHDEGLLESARQMGASEADTLNALQNVMSYHCDPQMLTALQVIRMRRALADHRRQVLDPPAQAASPVAEIRLPPQLAAGRVPFHNGLASLSLDGSASRDGEGGKLLTCRWSLVAGAPDGARFDTLAAGWDLGRSSLGYGGDDDLTLLEDMRGRYLSVYLTRSFNIADPVDLASIELDITYEDGFAAFLNGVEVLRRNLPPGAGPETAAASDLEGPVREVADLSRFRSAVRAGANRLSIQGHTALLDSPGFSMHPVLSARTRGGAAVAIIPSRAVWYLQRGARGAPPTDWREPAFDPASSRARVRFTQPGAYRFRLTVDDGHPPQNTSKAEVELVLGAAFFIRGDCNRDQALNLADAVHHLLELFSGAEPTSCPDACDTNDDERTNISDPIALLKFLFLSGPPPAAPFPRAGSDPGGEGLGCR